MIDVHILHLPNENKQWLKQCEESLVKEPIIIHNLNGIQGNIKKSRLDGFKLGTAPYVSFIDPDDYIIPGAFEKCLSALNPNICGVCTSYKIIDTESATENIFEPRKCYEIHQLVVMNREDVLEAFEKYYDEIPDNGGNEIYLYSAMRQKKSWKHIKFCGYAWRDHLNGSHYKYGPKYYYGLFKKIEETFPNLSVE